ncbi:MAG: biotin transporter BioY [Longimicrobiales bacterium]
MIESDVATELTLDEATLADTSRARPRPRVVRRPVGLSIGIPLFALLTALGAYAAVPMAPVPMTLQTLFVLLAGTVLGPSAGAASMLLYLFVGALGAPIFSVGGAGLGWAFGPTGGFLMAFPLAAAVAGWCAGQSKRTVPTLVGLVLASLVIFLLGAAWLGAISDLSLAGILQVAVVPFLVGAVVKVGIALVVTRQVAGMGARA